MLEAHSKGYCHQEFINDCPKNYKGRCEKRTLSKSKLEDKVVYQTFDFSALTEELKYISDYNRDGNRDIKDATAIQRQVAGLITAFAAEE